MRFSFKRSSRAAAMVALLALFIGAADVCVAANAPPPPPPTPIRCSRCRPDVCPATQACISGICACPAPTPDLCGTTCVNFATDNANCGACGNVCGAGTVCQSGQCRCPVIGVVIDVQQTTSSTVVATIACAGASSSELSFKCVSQGSPKESSGLGTVSYSGSTATVSGLSSCVPYDCYAVRTSPGGDVYSSIAPAVTIDDIAFSVANGFTTTNNQGNSVGCSTSFPYPLGTIKNQGPGTKWNEGVCISIVFYYFILLFSFVIMLTRSKFPRSISLSRAKNISLSFSSP